MQSTFSMEMFPHFAVGFRWNDQDASRARIFSWSGLFVRKFVNNVRQDIVTNYIWHIVTNVRQESVPIYRRDRNQC